MNKATSKLKNNLDMLKKASENLNKAKRKTVAVGLPKESSAGQIYGNGISVVTVGAWHEFGLGFNPVRSFLRMPFAEKKDEIDDVTVAQFKQLFQGKDVEKALGIIGAKARNISLQAFRTGGFGKWADNDPYTVKRKGSSKPLIDTGTLRNAITWVIR